MHPPSLDPARTARRLLPTLDRGSRSLVRLAEALARATAAGRRQGHRQGLREALTLAAELRLGPLPVAVQRQLLAAPTDALRAALGRLLRNQPDPLGPLPTPADPARPG